ncbi:hypothetical protein NE237_022697 [Protea cynaroides]|uniref:Neprosin PEP catalytic domain-containing protein n=1 Tax=Protea cynaroides TaxID=273540 RepID=A0A9Q0HAX1_9MAGN|nr:hypothetical protein NE237_022697 [Protea cynaroides]
MITQIMEINYEEDTRLHGASAIMNVYNPNAEAMQFTDAEISINDQSDFPSNFIVAGWTDRNTKNWWFDISQTKDESHNIHIGYWPGSILSSLGNGADSVSWAGYAKAGHDGVGPPMGNGLFPEDQKSCYMKYLKFVDDNYILRNSLNRTNVNVRVDSKKCYDLLYHADYTPNEGNSFRFGGPGGGKCD